MRKILCFGVLATVVASCEGAPDEVPVRDEGERAGAPAEPSPVVAAARERIRGQIAGRDLATAPPRIASTRVLPGDEPGQARLEVTFAEAVPAALEVMLADEVVTLRDDGRGPDRVAGDQVHTAVIRGELAPAVGGTEAVRSALTEVFPVFPERSLMITDPFVVNNYLRTTDPCHRPTGSTTPPADDKKKWTFGYLMTQMANQTATGISPSTFALKWLDEWAKDHTAANKNQVNGQDLKEVDDGFAGHTVARTIKAQWLKASGSTTTLDMKKAPFRLLAIVNRFDKRDNTSFGGGSAGELRFVFGVLDLQARETTNGTCTYMAGIDGSGKSTAGKRNSESNVILEFAVDKANQAAVRAYAESWNTLNDSRLWGKEDYLKALEIITEGVVVKGKSTTRANGSLLNVLRTNESNSGTAWDLREFAINKSTHLFTSTTVSQSPIQTLSESDDLDYWATFWAQAITDNKHIVPLTFATNEGRVYNNKYFRASHNRTDTDARTRIHFKVDLPGEVRHQLSLNSCTGCHHDEEVVTTNEPMHVIGRPWGEAALLSVFLKGDGNGHPQGVADPVNGDLHFFFDLDRRRRDLNDFLAGSALSALAFHPSARVH
jgi:hypothetical protein